MKLNVGCGEFYADGWYNVDIIDSDRHNIHPDQVVDILKMPEDINYLDAVYCGHFLEHIGFNKVVPFLTNLKTRMLPSAPIVVVGPDVRRADAMHANGRLDKATRDACHKTPHDGDWYGSTHFWDCDEDLVLASLTMAGFEMAAPVHIHSVRLNRYPVVARDPWQFAAMAFAPAVQQGLPRSRPRS